MVPHHIKFGKRFVQATCCNSLFCSLVGKQSGIKNKTNFSVLDGDVREFLVSSCYLTIIVLPQEQNRCSTQPDIGAPAMYTAMS